MDYSFCSVLEQRLHPILWIEIAFEVSVQCNGRVQLCSVIYELAKDPPVRGREEGGPGEN